MLLRDFVNKKMASADKEASAEGYPLTLNNCKKHKKMKQLEIYGNSVQDGTPTPETPIEVQSVGDLVTDTTDINYGKYKIPITTRGINLFSMAKAKLSQQTINGITFTPLDDERIHIKGKILDNTLSATYQTAFTTVIPIKSGIYNIKPNQYTGYQKDLSIMFGVYKDSNKNDFLVNINAMNNYTAINVKQDGYVGRIYINVSNSSTKEWDDIIELQITKGADAKNLPYEPYVEPITTNVFLDEPLRKIGDYADYIDFKSNRVVRKCIKKYLKDYNWGYYIDVQEYDTHYAYSHRDDTILPKYNTTGDMTKYRGYCNYLKSITSSSYSTITDAMFNHPWALNIRLTVSKDVIAEKTMSAFKAWLNENNPYMIRVLATPTEEPIDCDLPKLIAKTTIIEVDTSLAPSNAYGKYIKK